MKQFISYQLSAISYHGRNFFLWLIVIIAFLIGFACQKDTKTDSSSDSGSIFSFDDTDKAVDLVNSANTELRDVREIFQNSKDETTELYQAVKKKDVKQIKTLCESLKQLINDGLSHGENAISKLEDAQNLNINKTFKEYLSLKEDAIRKQIDAFKIRLETARLLRDQLDASPTFSVVKVNAELQDKENKFTDVFNAASDLHQKANALYKAKGDNE